MPFRLTVLGVGYLGAVQAICLASTGFEVLGIDTSPDRVAALNEGVLPFHEPGLASLLRQSLDAGLLNFSTDYRRAADFGDVHLICVGTPQLRSSNRADLTQLERCIDKLVPLLRRDCVIVGKCTVPVGTAALITDRIRQLVGSRCHTELAWSPEFLREGTAVKDTLRPDRIVVGVQSTHAERVLRELHADPIAAGIPFLVTDLATAELVKVAANSFIATKISFINAMAEICETVSGDVTALASALGYDPRIGEAGLRPGLGFGGGCLPKDIRAFVARAEELGADQSLAFLREVDAINLRRRTRAVELARQLTSGSLRGVRAAALGAAFKPDSDDVRDSPALDVAWTLRNFGAIVTVYDPVANEPARRVHPQLRYVGTAIEAVTDADVVLVLTEWAEFCDADPEQLGKAVAQRNIVDGRNVLDPVRWRAARWNYRAPGRR